MIELLAPAGDYEGMAGAIQAGADAVYAGGSLFGARAYAPNFDQEELLSAIDYVHIYGKKLYLTVNTLLKNPEMEGRLYDYLAPFYERGLDAVLVQDFGVLQFIRRQFPGLPIHASTQMTVTGPGGMRFLEDQGVSRVVAARELSLEELKAMHQASSLEIEAFVHGALCYCYSGQCLFSSLLGGRSGNRGRCAQPCRLPYRYSEDGRRFSKGDDFHILSPKDMCAIELIPQILKAGVVSLKIEGRMKRPGYTAGVVEVYRKYLDRYQQNPGEFRVEEKDKNRLLELFSRGGSHEGYFRQHNGPSMMAFHTEKKIAGSYPEIMKNKGKVKGILRLFSKKPAILELTYGDYRVRVEKGIVQEAKNQPMTEERIRRQLEKTGNTPYVFEALTIQMEEGIFLPVKSLNELRREAFLALTEQVREQYRRKRRDPLVRQPRLWPAKSEKPPLLSASCETMEQAEACLQREELHRIYLPLSLLDSCLPKAKSMGKEVFLMLPHMVRLHDLEGYEQKAKESFAKGLDGFLVRNLEGYAWVKERGFRHCCLLDASLYTWNDESQEFWREEGVLGDSAPLELNGKELRHRANGSSELLIYGRLPLMVSAQCVQKNMAACRKNQGVVWLQDRYQKEFPVKCYCDFCYNVIYNSLPYGLTGEAKQVKNLGFASLRLSFTLESGRETAAVLESFLAAYGWEPEGADVQTSFAFTKGHWKRGVE